VGASARPRAGRRGGLALAPDPAPLRRNREFALLESGRLLSSVGTAATTIAYPLLTLALTHSPAKAGLVGFARLLPYGLLALPAGLAADRCDRRRLMLGAEAVQAVAIGGLAVAVATDNAALWVIVAVAFVEGAGSVVFGVAQAGALRAVVPREQLPAAVAVQRGRSAAVQIIGPPLGGALFGLGRAVPFAADSATYAFSLLSLAAMRTPFQERRKTDPARLRSQIVEGFRFLWAHPFLRATTILYALGNVTVPALLLVVVVVGRQEGLSGGAIGLLTSVVGAAVLLGSALSPLVRRRLSMRAIIWTELWLGLGSGIFLVWPNAWVLVAGIAPQAVAFPITDSVVVSYRIAVTPDRLLGRSESVRTNLARLIDPLGPLVAGLLLGAFSPRAAVGLFTAWSIGLLVWGMLNPALRDAPRLEGLQALEAGS
jgi:predicted MFS family arabinose efflux permease